MTSQNAILVQKFINRHGATFHGFLTECGYETTAANNKRRAIEEDIAGDIEAGRGKEADEAIEEYGAFRIPSDSELLISKQELPYFEELSDAELIDHIHNLQSQKMRALDAMQNTERPNIRRRLRLDIVALNSQIGYLKQLATIRGSRRAPGT